MARAGPSRASQRYSQSQSQSQPGSQRRASQSQRQRRARHQEPEDEPEEEPEEEMEEDDPDADLRRGDADNDLARKANDLVRLALFNEHKRTPLRREEITKKVLGSSSRAFTIVFEKAQEILRSTFGMEMVELRSRAEVNKTANGANDEDDLDEARKAAGIKKRAAAIGSKTYILRSNLDPIIIEESLQTDEKILEEEMADAPSDDDDDDDAASSRSYGSIIAWNSTDHLAPIGFGYVVLALILVSGRVLGDNELKAYLKRLGANLTSKLRFGMHATQRNMTVDKYLEELIRHGYIERQRVGDNQKTGKGRGKRARPGADDDTGAQYEWRWGNRAYSEVGERGIAQFVAEFMVGDEDADEEEDAEAGGSRHARRGRQADDKSKFSKMVRGIERAAGGELADLK
ncbi:hypothetical protein HGRIS_004980 [Hohenbuehelia grisea]|uniref:MAGE domain-containing protein n=1 Tax=Hohenbuehelia grisea TaxID=104357 RepID=A0ABR3JE06_9AGAR